MSRGLGFITAGVVLAAAVAGCGGSSGSSTKSGSTAPPSHGQTNVAPATKPLPPGDSGYLTSEVERSTFETLAAGIASGRASGGVRSYARTTLAERAKITADDALVAKQLKLKLRPRAASAAQREELRKLVPLTGKRFDAAYLALEAKTIPADVSSAANAVKNGTSAKTRKIAAKHLAVYRTELRAVQALNRP